MDLEALLQAITPEMHANLQRAVEIGRWVDGTVLTGEQRELCMQAMIAWEARNLPEEERSGYMARGPSACGSACATPAGSGSGALQVVPASNQAV